MDPKNFVSKSGRKKVSKKAKNFMVLIFLRCGNKKNFIYSKKRAEDVGIFDIYCPNLNPVANMCRRLKIALLERIFRTKSVTYAVFDVF